MDKIRCLEMLVTAARAGSFTKAAKVLRLDPSAVSHSIAQLEKQLRLPLFYRTSRQLQLTDDGKEVLMRSTELLRGLSEIEGIASRRAERLSGSLRIGMSAHTSRQIIMPRLQRFMQVHPAVRIECFVLTDIKDMHAAGIDVMIKAGKPAQSGLIARRIGQVRFGVYASPGYLAAQGKPLSPEALQKHRCLVLQPPFEAKPWNHWHFERHGEQKTITVPCSLVTDDREGLLEAALCGAGIVRVGYFDPQLIASGRLVSLLGDWDCPGGADIYVLYRKSFKAAGKLRAFLNFVAQAYADFDSDEVTFRRDAAFASLGAKV